MTQVNIHYAKTHLSKLLEAVSRGEDIIIAKGNKPMAKLVALDAAEMPKKKSAWELLAGKFEGQISAQDIDYLCAPTDPEIIALFYGEDDATSESVA